MIQIHYRACFLGALLLLILPLDWFFAIVIASVFHEVCHIMTLYALGGSVTGIDVQAAGCMIKTNRIGEWKQFFSILAGPLGSLSLLLFCRIAPQIAVCGLVQCFSNLIPVLPLDGGRMLLLLLYHICPEVAEAVMDMVAIGICLLFVCLAIWLTVAVSAGPWPLFLAVVWIIRVLPGKIPCKPSQIKVQ